MGRKELPAPRRGCRRVVVRLGEVQWGEGWSGEGWSEDVWRGWGGRSGGGRRRRSVVWCVCVWWWVVGDKWLACLEHEQVFPVALIIRVSYLCHTCVILVLTLSMNRSFSSPSSVKIRIDISTWPTLSYGVAGGGLSKGSK